MTTDSWTAGEGTFNFGTEGQADANWSTGSTPNSTEDTVINTGSGTATITANSSEEVGSIALGTNDTLLIGDGAFFAAFDGTGPNTNTGHIKVNDATFILGDGGSATFSTMVAFESIALNSIVPPTPSGSGAAFLIINGSVELTGSGTVSLETANGGNDFIEGDPFAATTPTLTNVSEGISGAGTIGGNLNFINESGIGTGIFSTDGGQGGLTIEGSAVGGSFTNETGGQINVGDGGSITLGVDGETSTIVNAGGVIKLTYVHIGTKLEIAGNVTISSPGTAGSIDLATGTPGFISDKIISDGKSATLTLENQDLEGAGSIGDANLTLNNQSIIDAIAEAPGPSGPLVLVLNTGSNTITNAFGAFLEADGGELEIESPVNNLGEVEALDGGQVLIDAANGFTNNLNVVTSNGSTITFGADGQTSTIGNNNLIGLGGAGSTTSLRIAGNVTIDTVGSSSPGNIYLGGSTGSDAAADDQIVSDGHAAALTLVNQHLKGAGTVGDSNLTLDNESGTIEANIPGQFLTLATDSTITNGAAGSIVADNGGELLAAGPLNNSGTIVDDSSMFFEEPLSSSGTIDIGQGALLTAENTMSGNVTFTGPDATLNLSAPAQAGEIDIFGAVAGDQIGLQNTIYSPSMQVVWQQAGAGGTLTILNHNVAFETLNLAGQYTASDFALVDEGWAAINLPNPNPPSGTTGNMIMRDGNGDYEIFDLGSNSILAAYALGQASTAWQVAGVGDFDGTDTSDIMTRNNSTGAFEVWDVANNNMTGPAAAGQIGTSWSIAAFGDFSGNPNETDMLMDEPAGNGQLGYQVFDISNNVISAPPGGGGNVGQAGDLGFFGPIGSPWQVVGTGDFSGNPGETDVMMRNGNQFEVFDISHNQFTGAVTAGAIGAPWSVVTFGDFSGNPNETDMLMDEPAGNGELDYQVFDISNNVISAPPGSDGNVGQPGDLGFFGPIGPEWQVVGTGDFSGNPGETDVMMRDSNNGAFEVFDISNNQLVNAASIGQVGTEWSVAGIAADPPGAPSPTNAQLAQAMASLAPSDGTADSGAALGQPAPQPAPSLLAPASQLPSA